jgi:hypothetical protein
LTPANSNADRGYFCPSCGGADVTASGLAGGEAKCNICTWSGTVEELATFHFMHETGSPEEIARAFFSDMRKVLARDFAQQIGLWLIRWGFMDAPDSKNMKDVQRVLSRYLGIAAQAMVKAIITERQKIEREKHGDTTNTPSA